MATKQKDKAASKPKQRNRKPAPQSEKLDQVQSPKLDPEIEEQIVPEVAAIESAAIEAVAIEAVAVEAVAVQAVAGDETLVIDEAAPAELVSAEHTSAIEVATTEVIPAMSAPMELASPVELTTTATEKAAVSDQAPVGLQSIANAYRNYAHKSLEQTGSFVEKLMSVRSFDKAAEVQIEFARQACANLIAESQNICQLYSRWTGQMFRSWQGFAIGAPAK